MYVCSECGNASAIKLGKCPECWAFGSFVSAAGILGAWKKKWGWVSGQTLTATEKKWASYFPLVDAELIRLFPKGLKEWGVYLLGGEPGIGKSTIALQIIHQLTNLRIAYFSGEEQSDQITDRHHRLAVNSQSTDHKAQSNIKNPTSKIYNSEFDIYHSNAVEDILLTAETGQYQVVIIDSIQTISSANLEGASGSPAQVKYCAEKIAELSKKKNITTLIIGHVTKGGEIAGPKYLEHLVDAVLYLEGDRYGQYRILRYMKNRFWSTDEIAIFEMTLFWLKPVYDLKERIVWSANLTIPWSVLTVWIDNGRPVVVHLEVLLNKTQGKFPVRQVVGVEGKRVDLIIAILERYLKAKLWWFDVFVNIPWEFSFHDSGLDLAIAAGIYSQFKNVVVDKNLLFLGEIGLGWQILPTKLHEKRKKEMWESMIVIDYTRIKHIAELVNII